jgi:hypothetical protein
MLSPEALRGKQIFLLGTTSFLGWTSVAVLAASLAAALPLALRLARALDALVLGEASAASLGLPLPRVRLLLVALMALATGTAVAQAGLVAFVGLVAPHLVRRLVVVTHGPLLALSALAGARAAAGRRRGRAQRHRAAGTAGGAADRGVRRHLPAGAAAPALPRVNARAAAGRAPRPVPAPGRRRGRDERVDELHAGAVGGHRRPQRRRQEHAAVAAGRAAGARRRPGAGCRAAAWPTGRPRAGTAPGLAVAAGRGRRRHRARDVVRLGRLPRQGLFGAPDAADEAAVQRALAETEATPPLPRGA